MKPRQKIFAEILFKLKVLESKGTVFQGLFEDLMKCVEPDFKKVRAYGKDGDQKNDGFVPNKGIYYQVYAPKDPSLKDSDASKKLEEDFAGLLDYWKDKYEVLEYYFVFNDEYLGLAPLLYAKVVELQKREPSIKIGILMCDDLHKLFCNLSDIDLQKIIGFIPDPEELDLVDLESLTEVIKFLLDENKNFQYSGKLVVPDFTEKIEFNNLSPQVGNLLNLGSYQLFALEQYFEGYPDQKDVLQAVFSKYYSESIEKIDSSMSNYSDFVFFNILKKATSNSRQDKQVQDAIIVLMSSYFETCDIFEEPVK